jgi:hypothetical protein
MGFYLKVNGINNIDYKLKNKHHATDSKII